MATDSLNEQEIQLKKRARRRLVGAAALVLLMVTVLPMLLDDQEPRVPEQEIEISIPSQDGAGFSSSIIPAEAPPATLPAIPPATEAVVPPSASPAPTAEPAAPAAPTAKESEKPVFFVQIGVFSDPARVKELQHKLQGGGVQSHTEKIDTAKGARIRLRSGPYGSRQEADEALDKIRSAGGVGSMIASGK